MSTEKTPSDVLASQLEEAKKQVRVGGVYSHWRNPGNHYLVVNLAFCEWDEQIAVVYQPLYGDQSLTWIRRLKGEDGWLTPVDNNGQQIPRFSLVEY